MMGVNPAARLETMGAQFSQNADDMYASLMNLNVPTANVKSKMDRLLLLRDQMIQLSAQMGMIGPGTGVTPVKAVQAQPLYGPGGQQQWTMPDGAAKGKGKGAKKKAKGDGKGASTWTVKVPGVPVKPEEVTTSAAHKSDANFKSVLHEAVGRVLVGRPLSKEDIVYSAQNFDDGLGNVTYQVQIVVSTSGAAYLGEVQVNRKLAEQAAAKEALAVEFPMAYQELITANPALATGLGTLAAAREPGHHGQKRGPPGDGARPERQGDPKAKLMQGVRLLLDRDLIKEDVVYTSQDNPGGGHIAMVQLPCYDNAYFQGAVGATRKDAEKNAAQAALTALHDIIAPLEVEHREKRARQSQEQLEAEQAAAAGL